ncbi:hypothetical protein [Planctobacterium marinum]|uniref:hypothetical protein n=1 Tax=Planctobacterium marinum TaxID=1631968 RepID=UPI001E2C199E|nr:hypothetical protein [Planctobacterium marinum]MCC2604906.1 hypothetical protein [Planctobacterium marinum]
MLEQITRDNTIIDITSRGEKEQINGGLFKTTLGSVGAVVDNVSNVNNDTATIVKKSADTLDKLLDSSASTSTPASGEGLFSDNDISDLQRQFAGALKTSLLTSSAASQQSNSEVASTDQDVPQNQTSEAEPTSIIEGMMNDAEKAFDSFVSFSFGADGAGIEDVFEAVNPLNHIPIVSDIYKGTTPTDISAASAIAGGFIAGGPMGAAYAAIDTATESVTGDSITENAFNLGAELVSNISA